VELPADGAQDGIVWVGDDFPAGVIYPFQPITISCALPAGAGLNDMYFEYWEDSGN